MLFNALAFAQTRTVTGRVTDDKGNPVPFATITEVGTNKATQANENGEYTITIGANSRLSVSSTGFQGRSMNVSGPMP